MASCRPPRVSSSAASTATGGRGSSVTSTCGSSLSLPVRPSAEAAWVQQRTTSSYDRPNAHPLLAVVEPLSEGSDSEAEQLAGTIEARAPLADLGRDSTADSASAGIDASSNSYQTAGDEMSMHSTSSAQRRHWMLGRGSSGGVAAECAAVTSHIVGEDTPSTSTPQSALRRHSAGSEIAVEDEKPTPPPGPPTCPQPPLSPKRQAAPPAAPRRKHWMLGASRDPAAQSS